MLLDQIRQGDILLVATPNKVPNGIKPKKEVILAGTPPSLRTLRHRLTARAVYEWSVNGQRYVHVSGTESGKISHEEHDPMPAAVVEPGITYRIIPQQEWDLSGQWKKVVD